MLTKAEACTAATKDMLAAQPVRGHWRPWLSRLLIALAILLSAGLLYRTLSNYDVDELTASVTSVPLSSLFAAIGWAAASYLCLTINDWLALRFVGKPQPYPYAALTSFVALGFGHNIGFAALSSGAIRYRFYSRKGLGAEAVAKIIVFCGVTIFLGMFVLGDLALLFRPDFAEIMTGLSGQAVYLIGGALLSVPLIYLGLAATMRRPLKFRHWSVEMPPPVFAAAQIAVGTVNFTFVAACLYAIVSPIAEVGYFEVLAAFVIANTATIITHAPGGLGVMETVVLLLLRRPELIGAILVFRFVYYLLPLALATILFALSEIHWRRR